MSELSTSNDRLIRTSIVFPYDQSRFISYVGNNGH